MTNEVTVSHARFSEELKSRDSKVDVVLIQEASPAVVCEPMSITSLASFLRQEGFRCGLVQFDSDLELSGLVTTIMAHNPTLVGISVLSSISRPTAQSLFREFNQQKFRGVTCVGGYDPSLAPGDWLDEPGVDLIVLGEGELPLLEIARQLSSRTDLQSLNLPGGVIRTTNARIVPTLGSRVRDLDSLPFPTREMLPTIDGQAVGEVGIVSGRGCYAHCSFCAVHHFARLDTGRAFRQRSVDNVLDEIIELNGRFGANDFYFYDDVFTLPGKHGVKRAEEFKEKVLALPIKITFGIYQRPDCVIPDILNPLAQAGLNRVFVGIESFSDKDLTYFAKNATAKQHVKAMETLESAGFSPEPGARRRARIGMIPLHPFSTKLSLAENIAQCKRFRIPPKRMGLRLEIYPHTQSEKDAADHGLLNTDYSWKYRDEELYHVEEAFQLILRRVGEVREPLRQIEKLVELVEPGRISKAKSATTIRRCLDEETLSLLEKANRAVTFKEDISDIETELEENCGRLLKDGRRWLASLSDEIEEVTSKAEKRLVLATSNVFDQSHFRNSSFDPAP